MLFVLNIDHCDQRSETLFFLAIIYILCDVTTVFALSRTNMSEKHARWIPLSMSFFPFGVLERKLLGNWIDSWSLPSFLF